MDKTSSKRTVRRAAKATDVVADETPKKRIVKAKASKTEEIATEPVKKTRVRKTAGEKTIDVSATEETKVKAVRKKTETAAVVKETAARAKKAAKAEAVVEKVEKATKARKKAAEKTEPVKKATRRSKVKVIDIELVEDVKPVEYVLGEEVAVVESEEEPTPVFKELAEPRLPSLPSENRARLQMQSPHRVFFYWSMKNNPYESLGKAIGDRGMGYQLAAKLVNLSSKKEELYPVDANGSWWFNVESDSAYRAEIGLFAQNRPFIRLMFSNTIETPRSSPSPRNDWTPDFYVSSEKFAETLDASGFATDARHVALAGDEAKHSDNAALAAYAEVTGIMSAVSPNEIRYVLFALASGVSLESLRGYISPTLFADLSAANLSGDQVLAVLREHFGYDPIEADYEEEVYSPVTYGASLINFPKVLKKRRSQLPPGAPGLRPVSSHVNR
jgi:hypothetical protein